jgi:hypothetical protein
MQAIRGGAPERVEQAARHRSALFSIVAMQQEVASEIRRQRAV